MKTKCIVIIVAFAALALSGCASKPADMILGKWEAGEGPVKMTIEFASNGKANLTMLGQTLSGTYKINGDDELEWTLNGKTTKGKMKVTATEFEFTSEGKTVKYRRV